MSPGGLVWCSGEKAGEWPGRGEEGEEGSEAEYLKGRLIGEYQTHSLLVEVVPPDP